MTANKEKFDCLKMKTDIQAQIFSETQNMSVPELLDYFNKNKSCPPEMPGTQTVPEKSCHENE
jgi:hypothetical protein